MIGDRDNRAWIGVDLDGTLAFYDEWNGVEYIGTPIPVMVERIKVWRAAGIIVKIFTARVADRPDAATIAQAKQWKWEAIRRIQDWLESAGLPRLEVTNVKDRDMIELWDDRAVQVIKNSGQTAEEYKRGWIAKI